MDATIKYTSKEVEEIMARQVSKILPPPDGFYWNVTNKTYGGAECVLLEGENMPTPQTPVIVEGQTRK